MAMYSRSFCDSLNFDLNLDFLREASFWGIFECGNVILINYVKNRFKIQYAA